MPIAERFAAIDTQLLYGDSCGVTHHRVAIEFLRQRLGFEFVIVPSVIREILVASDEGGDELKRQTHLVIQDIDDSNYIKHPVLRETYERSFRIHATELLNNGAIPGANKQAIRVLLEASHFDCTELLTTRRALIDAPTGRVNKALAACGLRPIRVLSPQHFKGSC